MVAPLIRAEVDCSIELMDELHIEVTIHGHELDQIKLLTDRQSLSKVIKVVPPMIDVNGPHPGELVLVMLKNF